MRNLIITTMLAIMLASCGGGGAPDVTPDPKPTGNPVHYWENDIGYIQEAIGNGTEYYNLVVIDGGSAVFQLDPVAGEPISVPVTGKKAVPYAHGEQGFTNPRIKGS